MQSGKHGERYKMNIAVLGGTGYLGSRIIQKLVLKGNKVLCITRNPQKYENDYLCTYCGMDNCEKEIRAFMPDVLINVACCYLKGNATELDVLEANFENPVRILLACVNAGVKRIITAGTALPDNLNLYSFSKKLFRDYVAWYIEKRQTEFVHLRLETFYGEEQSEIQFLPRIAGKMKRNETIELTAGTQKRDFIHVDDVVNVFVKMIDVEMKEKVVELSIGTGEAVTIREIVEYLHEITESESQLLFGSVPMRAGEPDTVADRQQMERWGLGVQYTWKQGMKKVYGRKK